MKKVITTLFSLFTVFSTYGKEHNRYAICYSSIVPVNELRKFDTVILDPNSKVDIPLLKEKGKVLYSYLSLGEVNNNRWYFKKLRKGNILLEESKTWQGSYKIDVRRKFWKKFVLTELVPSILHKGYDGIFLDTVDYPIELERVNPDKYKGMKSALVDLIKSIRYHFPQIKIIMNRGYPIITDVGKEIDGILGESIYSTYDFKNKVYRQVKPDLYRKQVDILHDAIKKFPSMKVYSLDYWDDKDADKIKGIYRIQRKNGFIPYVSNIALDKIVGEPNEK